MKNKKYYDILCPGCFRKLKPNNVVFCEDGNGSYFDRYAEAQVIENKVRNLPGNTYYDPADCSYEKVYNDNGVILKIKDEKVGLNVDIRLCPYCHHKIPFSYIGDKEIRVVSVIGCSGAGKSVYEKALIKRLTDIGLGIMLADDDNKIDDLGDCSQSVTTTSIAGPFIYHISNDSEVFKTKFYLHMYDMPGEVFNKLSRLNENYVSEILKLSELVIFIIDPTNIDDSRTALSNYLVYISRNGKEFIPTHFALLINRTDEIGSETCKKFAKFNKSHQDDERNNQLNLETLQLDSNSVKNLVKNILGIPLEDIPSNSMFFTSQLFDDGTKNVEPKRQEEPFLWWLQTMSDQS